jgi:hypothetical protein
VSNRYSNFDLRSPLTGAGVKTEFVFSKMLRVRKEADGPAVRFVPSSAGADGSAGNLRFLTRAPTSWLNPQNSARFGRGAANVPFGEYAIFHPIPVIGECVVPNSVIFSGE